MNGEIENGGVHQFLWNSSGDFAEEAKQHLAEIRALGALGVLRKAGAVFPRGVISRDQTKRQRAIEKHQKRGAKRSTDLWTTLNREYRHASSELHERLYERVRGHQEEFPDPDDEPARRQSLRP
jgi:hypothetical protein